jgi:hypothetical protein
MWKHLSESVTGAAPFELSVPPVAEWPWRKLLADVGLVAAFALTSSFLWNR